MQALWSDGLVQDVSKWALFDSSDNNVAEVANDGRLMAKGPGRTAITVRFMGQVASVSVTVPFANISDFPSFATTNFIDEHILAEWKTVGLIPSAVSDDATFLRRVSLDLIGLLPTPTEVREFLASNDPLKRTKVIDTLLTRREYVDCWTLKWSELLRVHRRALGEKGLDSFQNWLRSKLRENQSAQILVTEVTHREREPVRQRPGRVLFRRSDASLISRRRPRRFFSACECNVRSVIITRSRCGARTTITDWPRSSLACSAKTRKRGDASAARSRSS